MLAPNSPIAARGVQLLSTLLGEEAKHRRSAASALGAAKKRKAPSESERFGQVAKRVVSNARSAGSAGDRSSNNSTTAISPTLNPVTSLPPFYLSSTQHSPTLGDLPLLDASSSASVAGHINTNGMAEGGSLTQDAFDSILLSGLGAQLYMGNGGASEMANPNVDFWRMLDATFEPVQGGPGGGGTASAEGVSAAGFGGADDLLAGGAVEAGAGAWEMPFEFGGGGGGFGGDELGWA